MRRLSLALLVVLSVVFLALLAPFVLNPELYTLYNESYTSYHSNPAALWEYSYERSEDIQGMMQELLDAPQPIVLNIKIKDFEEARREFEEYKEKSRYFNEVVVNLDLTDSTIGDFRRENRKNMEVLEQMVNESARFDEINRLEIKYRSEDNPALLYTIALEGEAIHRALDKSNTRFKEREPDVLEISDQLELNSTKYKEAVDMLEEVLKEDRKRQEEREMNKPVLPVSSLSLSVTPDLGQYGDTLRVDGAYTYFTPQEVTLVLDSRDWKTLTPDKNGVFSTTLPIERIRGGDHVIFATTGLFYSNLETFTILPTDTVLTLELYQGERWEEIYLYGELHAGEIAVPDAPVRILADDFEATIFETDEGGYYYGSLNLTEGNHTLQAIFDDRSYPLNPSESKVQYADLTPAVSLMVAVGVGAAALFVTVLGSVWYLRRRDLPVITEESPVEKAHQDFLSQSEPTKAQSSVTSPIDLLSQYQTRFDAGDLSGAAALLYRSVVERVIPLPGVSDSYALTPRELASHLTSTPAGEFVRSFVRRYEEVRYAGMPLQQRDVLLTYWNAILAAFESGQGGRS